MRFGDMEPGREYPMSDLGDAVRAAAEQARAMNVLPDDVEYGYEEQPTGADGRYIRDRLMPEFWERFARKAKDYNTKDGFEPHRVLGVPGQFAEVWRKVFKLKKAMWDGEPLIHEQPREVLMDMVGHCFLALAMLDGRPEGAQYGKVPTVAGEPWQGRTKPRPVVQDDEEYPESIKRPNGSIVTLYRQFGDSPWPMCGRERCIACTKATLRTVLSNTDAKIIKGSANNWDDDHPEPLDRAVAHSATAASQNACPCHECVDGHG